MTIPEPQYDQNIPNPNDVLADSQESFLVNFQQLYDAFAKNHVALDAATLAGTHNVVELLQQEKGFHTDVGEISLYSKNVEGQADQLFLRYQGNTQEVQMTNYQIYSDPVIQDGQFGYFSYLPGGLILYFGGVNFSKTNNRTLYLAPFITKNVIAFNLCASGTLSLPAPWVVFLAERAGIVTTIQANANSFVAGVVYYYIVLGNT